jgi:hypothetical protein
VSHRTQITLTNDQYETLQRESRRTGMSLAELVRRAVARAYGAPESASAEALDESFGAWRNRDFDGAQYVERIRRPGLGRRLGL